MPDVGEFSGCLRDSFVGIKDLFIRNSPQDHIEKLKKKRVLRVFPRPPTSYRVTKEYVETTKARGLLHYVSARLCMVLMLVVLFYAHNLKQAFVGFIAYAMSAFMFHHSSKYHLTRWSGSDTKDFMRQVDHFNIVFLGDITYFLYLWVYVGLDKAVSQKILLMLVTAFIVSMAKTLATVHVSNAIQSAILLLHTLPFLFYGSDMLAALPEDVKRWPLRGIISLVLGAIPFAAEKPNLHIFTQNPESIAAFQKVIFRNLYKRLL